MRLFVRAPLRERLYSADAIRAAMERHHTAVRGRTFPVPRFAAPRCFDASFDCAVLRRTVGAVCAASGDDPARAIAEVARYHFGDGASDGDGGGVSDDDRWLKTTWMAFTSGS